MPRPVSATVSRAEPPATPNETLYVLPAAGWNAAPTGAPPPLVTPVRQARCLAGQPLPGAGRSSKAPLADVAFTPSKKPATDCVPAAVPDADAAGWPWARNSLAPFVSGTFVKRASVGHPPPALLNENTTVAALASL